MARPHPISEDRIRERAYRLWLEESQPQGRSVEHWDKARALLALESDPEKGIVSGEETNILRKQEIPKKRRPSVACEPAKRRAM